MPPLSTACDFCLSRKVLTAASRYVTIAAMDALDLAIERAGGVAKLALSIGRRPNVVSNWRARGVPEDACPDIERETGVLVEALRPELPWHRDEAGYIYVRKTG